MDEKWEVCHFDVSGHAVKRRVTTTILAAQLRAGLLSWSDFGRPLSGADRDWRRLFEIEALAHAMPELPVDIDLSHPPKFNGPKRVDPMSLEPTLQAEEPSVVSDLTLAAIDENKPEWFIQFSGSEFGPFAGQELQKIISSGKLSGDIYLWHPTLENWMPISAFSGLMKLMPGNPVLRKVRRKVGGQKLELLSKREARLNQRQALIATISLADNNEIIGVCLNISETGVQVLLDTEFQISAEESIMLRISPVGTTGLAPITSLTSLSWIDVRGKRAGFRFKNLSDADNESLQKYLDRVRTRSWSAQAQGGKWQSVELETEPNPSKKPA